VRPRRCSYPHCGGGRRRGPARPGASLRRQTPARSSRTRCILDAAAIDIAEKDAGEEQQGEVRPARCSYRHCRGGRRRDGDQWGDHTHNAAYPVSIGFDAPPPVTASPSCSSPPPRSSYSQARPIALHLKFRPTIPVPLPTLFSDKYSAPRSTETLLEHTPVE
jgi:hypothetical protein